MQGPCGKITESELEVMRLLWQAEQPLPLSDIRARLEPATGWESSTIKTLLRRLCEKGAVEARKDKVFYYTPRVSEQEYERYTAESLVDRVFGGSAKNLMASLARGGKLTERDVAELLEMLERGEFDG